MSDLANKLSDLLDYVEDIDSEEFSWGILANKLETCLALAKELDALAEQITHSLVVLAEKATIVEVNCKRCDRPFRTIEGVEYCTRSCELGGWPQGHKS